MDLIQYTYAPIISKQMYIVQCIHIYVGLHCSNFCRNFNAWNRITCPRISGFQQKKHWSVCIFCLAKKAWKFKIQNLKFARKHRVLLSTSVFISLLFTCELEESAKSRRIKFVILVEVQSVHSFALVFAHNSAISRGLSLCIPEVYMSFIDVLVSVGKPAGIFAKPTGTSRMQKARYSLEKFTRPQC